MYKAVEVNKVHKTFFRTNHQGLRYSRQNLGLRSVLPQVSHPGNQNAVTVAVDRVSFSVERGEIFGLLGPEGSGKSTIIRLLAGLLLPDEGEIRIFGYNLASHLHQVQRQINNVSGQASFFRNLTPLENLVYGARTYGLNASEIRVMAEELLNRIGLSQQESKKPLSCLSHAALQKIRIAHALLSCPRLLLLDEPTTGLDPNSKLEVQQIIQEHNHEHGTTVFLTMSDRVDGENLCGRIAEISSGKLAEIYPSKPSQLGCASGQFMIIQEPFRQEQPECVKA